MRNLLPRNDDGRRALLPRRLVFSIMVVLCVGARKVTASSSSSSKIVELTTATFEHQTQAATGQTTGKWFVKFVAPWCGHCQRLAPEWEQLADDLHNNQETFEFVLASVDCTKDPDVCARFGIQGYPALKLFAHQQMYTYDGPRTVEAMQAYLSQGEFGTTGLPVPAPPHWSAPFHKLYQDVENDLKHIVSLRKNAAVLLIGMGILVGMLLMVCLSCLISKKNEVPKTTKKE